MREISNIYRNIEYIYEKFYSYLLELLIIIIDENMNCNIISFSYNMSKILINVISFFYLCQINRKNHILYILI